MLYKKNGVSSSISIDQLTLFLFQHAMDSITPDDAIHSEFPGATPLMTIVAAQKPPLKFFQLPLEIRDIVYSFVLAADGKSHLPYAFSFSHYKRHSCLLNMIRCCRQMCEDLRNIFHRQTVYFGTEPDTSQLMSNFPCLHGVPISEVRSLLFEVNPFQYVPTVPEVRKSILSICTALRKVKHISYLRVECDGTVPRNKPPLYINEIDLERGPWIIAILLQPFSLLHNVVKAQIAICGGALNEPWSTNGYLMGFIMRLQKKMEDPEPLQSQKPGSISTLQKRIEQENLFDIFRDVYESIVKETCLSTYWDWSEKSALSFSRTCT